jgi:hypothetical protein
LLADDATSDIDASSSRPLTEPIPSPPSLDAAAVPAPKHKKFGKFRCLLGDNASSSPSSSSDDQTAVVEEWSTSDIATVEQNESPVEQSASPVEHNESPDLQPEEQSISEQSIVAVEEIAVVEEWTSLDMVVAEEVVLAQEESRMSQEEMVIEEPTEESTEKEEDIEPSFERLSILAQQETESKVEEAEAAPQSDVTLDSQTSMDLESSSSNQVQSGNLNLTFAVFIYGFTCFLYSLYSWSTEGSER